MQTHPAPRRTRTVNISLVIVALMLGIDIGTRLDGDATIATAHAQGLVNPADQREKMIAELQAMNRKLQALTTTITKTFGKGPVDVSVVDFPMEMLVSD
jgi:hypothetical protein